jgi:predicted Zn-dependent peptidase
MTITLSHTQDAGAVRTGILPNGVRILTESLAESRTASVGLWLPVGSRDEAAGFHGSTHFLEHLVFKGTAGRSALDIAEAFDRVGAEANAATSKEYTCYYARLLDRDLPMAVEVLCDMVTGALLEPGAFELERGVILEELAMAADDPADVAGEAFAAAVFAGSELARPIGGTPDSIKALDRDAVWGHYRRHYRPDNLVVTAAGAVDHDQLAQMVAQGLARGGWADGPAAPSSRRPSTPAALPPKGEVRAIARPTEQAHVLVGCRGGTATNPDRYAMAALTTVLGGGMSSRLFQEIREARGLAYSTYAMAEQLSDAGAFGLYAACAPGAVEPVQELMEQIWAAVAGQGVTEDELARAKGQLAGGTVLALEDPHSRMNRLGMAELVTGELPTIDQVLARIDAVTAAQVQELAANLSARPRSRVVVAPDR